MTKVVIYTDGACKGNPGPGGWAAILNYGEHQKSISGYEPMTTNNRMEITAAVEALKILSRACQVELFTDSQYLKNGITSWIFSWRKNGWLSSDKKPVKNQDLWKVLDKLAAEHKITWHWVKAHNGNVLNEQVDALARQAIESSRGP
jgi:ribonuclease HI